MLSLVFPGVITIMFFECVSTAGKKQELLSLQNSVVRNFQCFSRWIAQRREETGVAWLTNLCGATFSMLFKVDCTEKGEHRSCLAYK